MRNTVYFNFPIEILKNYLNEGDINDMLDYAVYDHCQKLETSMTIEDRLIVCERFFKIRLGNKQRDYNAGKKLYNKYWNKTVMVGINSEIFFDYYKNEKSEFEKVCLLGFLAIKSILQKKTYCKIDNKFWLSRMDGKPRSCELSDLSEPIKKYSKHYQARKIKEALEDGWNLKTYSHYTRGFYVSFKLSKEELVYEAEKRRKSVKDKQRKERERKARQQALDRLYNSQL